MKQMRNLMLVSFYFSAVLLQAQTSFFVSASGKDSNKGTMKQPFLTIEKALETARNEKGEVTLYLREGVYRLSAPLTLTASDGNSEKKLTLTSFPNEKATISGGVLLNLDWKPYKRGILQAKVNQDVAIDMLLVNGEIRHMARYPNYDEQAVRFHGTSSQATTPNRVKSWKHPETGFLHVMHNSDWGDFHYRINGMKENGELILEGGWQNNRQSGLHPENRMVENIFEELDAPGEWFFDHNRKILYYYPLEGEQTTTAIFETPRLKHLIEVRGTQSDPAANIVIKNLNLTQTQRTFMEPYEALLRSDWTIYRGAAVFFEGTENCTLTQCDLYNLGGNAVFFSKYNRHGEVSSSHFKNIGASAICFVGDTACVRSPSFEYSQFIPYEKMDLQKGPKGVNFPALCTVHDNLIHRIGLYEKQTTGVELSMCQSIVVSHNSIYDTPRAGINISEGTWGGHCIEYNDVFETVKETSDHGSFNSWGRDRFWHPNYKVMEELATRHPEMILLDAVKTTTIHNNRFRCDHGWDIDLDDGSSNYHIYNNLCLNGGIKLREGFYRIVENNVMVNNSFHPHVWFLNSRDVFTRNVVMTDYQPIQVRTWGLMVDYNIFSTTAALNNARKNQTDLHSKVCPLPFRNPQAGDFSFPDDAEVIVDAGFHNFPMDEFGVISPRLKRIARQPEMPQVMNFETDHAVVTKQWQGIVLKDLTTLGERSATGMDSEHGVYVLSVNPPEGIHTKIRSNDVLLKVNQETVNNLKEFFQVLKDYKSGDTVFLTIFRSQKEMEISFKLK